MTDENLRTKTVWTGKYRDITYEVNNWNVDGIGDCWSFYLYIQLAQLPEEISERFWLPGKPAGIGKHIMFDYNSETLIRDLDWHCGCTYYKKHGHDGEQRVVQIGCDYSHYWDQGHRYNIDYVAQEARACIDSLHEMIDDIKRWCTYCGVFFRPEDDEQRCKDCKDK